jgi:AraC-like DNA-binding protein
MANCAQPLAVALPGLRATRVMSEAPYAGVKDSFLISRFEAGRSEFWSHGRTWSGGPGSLIVFSPGDVHRELRREGTIRYQLIHLSGRHARELEALPIRGCFAPGDPRAAPFHNLHDAVAAGADAFALECALAEAIAAMTGMPSVGDARLAPTRPVRRALGLMREQLDEPLSLDALARHAGLDKFHLCRAFRAQIGMPPHAYLTQLRILRAKALLRAGARPRDVAPQVGLYDQSQLNRHFRRLVGMTPGQFLAKNRQSSTALPL